MLQPFACGVELLLRTLPSKCKDIQSVELAGNPENARFVGCVPHPINPATSSNRKHLRDKLLIFTPSSRDLSLACSFISSAQAAEC